VRTEQLFAASGALLGGLSVIAGAFGSHFLKARLHPDLLSALETGVRYQMYHALALFAVVWACSRWPLVQPSGWFFIAGSVIFCGSLYALAVTGARSWGAVTPVGGAAFIIGWLLFLRGIWRG